MKTLLRSAICLLASVLGTAAWAAPAGSLDPTFGDSGGNSGYTIAGFNKGGDWTDLPEAMVAGPGGTVYLIGTVELDGGRQGFGLVRVRHDGTIDTTFAPGGKKFHDEPSYVTLNVQDAAAQADGKLVVVGFAIAGTPNTFDMLACRFQASGDIDATFGNPQTPGCRRIPSPIGIEASANAVLIQPDGRIVLAGYAFNATKGFSQAAMVRLMPNGIPDSSFGNQGPNAPGFRLPFLGTPADTALTQLEDIARTVDGKLVVVGDHGNGGSAITDALVARMGEANGALDAAFNGTGYATITLNKGGDNVDSARSVLALSDGSVLVAGGARYDFTRTGPFVAKLNASGKPDVAFGNDNVDDEGNGVVDFGVCLVDNCDMTARDMQLTPGGQILMAGRTPNSGANLDFFVMRLSATGFPDPTYGPNGGAETGIAVIDIAGGDDSAYRILPQGDRVLVGGWAEGPGNIDFAIVRLDHGHTDQFVVSPDPGPGGWMSPATDQIVSHSDQVDFTVVADAGFSVGPVTGCGVTEFQEVYTTAPVTEDCIVTAQFLADLVATYTAGPNGSLVGKTSQDIAFGGDGSPVQAVANANYHFTQWDDGVLDNPRQDLDVTQNIDVTALFVLNQYSVEPNPGPNGALSPDVPQIVSHGQSTQFIAQPDPGFTIDQITGCPGTLQGNVFTTDPAIADCKVTVTFVATTQMFSLQYLSNGHGSIVGDAQQSVLSGADGTAVLAQADPDYVFATWSDGVTDNPRQDTHVVDDIAVTAQFVADETFVVTPSAGSGGSISPNVPQQVQAGDSAIFTLTPDAGFMIDNIGGTCDGSLNGNTFTTAPITASCTVHATFVSEAEAAAAIFSDSFED